ncbi:MAG: hypothetical protein Q4G42_00640 [Neisseria sp.]|nr:hypothetical protein [Neisseria sp.]
MVFINRVSQFTGDCTQSDSALRQHLKTTYGCDTRRMSRLTLLALSGALPLSVPQDCSVYMASSFASPSKFNTVFDALLYENSAMPFDFIANMHNAAVFHVARLLNTRGNTVFVYANQDSRSWTQPLLCALSDLLGGQCRNALVGWAHEYHPVPDASPQEGSHWLWLSRDAVPNPLASCRITADEHSPDSTAAGSLKDYYWQAVTDALAQLQQGQIVRLRSALDQKIIWLPETA